MKFLSMFVVFLVIVPSYSHASKGQYDEFLESVQRKMHKAEASKGGREDPYEDPVEKIASVDLLKECEKRFSGYLIKQMKCAGDMWKILEKEGGIRGNKFYAEKHYGTLTSKELINKYEELFRLGTSDDVPTMDDGYGYVNREDFETELRWVHLELVRRKVKFRPRISTY